jgi:thioredoxin-like negative regulator of GroEL
MVMKEILFGMNLDIKNNQKQETMPMSVREITSVATLRQTISSEYRLVFCKTSWSVPCRNQYSVLVKIAEFYTGWESIAQVDIEKYPDVAAKMAIQSIPTILVFHRGKEIHRIVGLQSLENLSKTLTDNLSARVSTLFNDKIENTLQESNQALKG